MDTGDKDNHYYKLNNRKITYQCCHDFDIFERMWYSELSFNESKRNEIDLFLFSPLNSAQHSFPGGSEVKASACSAGDLGLIPGSGRSPGEGNGNPLQHSCLENPMERGAW